MARIDLEDPLQRRQRHRVELEVVAIQGRDLEQPLDPVRRVVRRLPDAVELVLEQVDERGPLPARPVQALERLGGLGVVAVLADHRAPHLDRTVRALQPLLGDLRHLGGEREPLLGVLAGAPRLHEHLDELRRGRRLAKEIAVEVQHLLAARLAAPDPAEVGLGELSLPRQAPDRSAGEQRHLVARRIAGRSLGGGLRRVDHIRIIGAVEHEPPQHGGDRGRRGGIVLGVLAGVGELRPLEDRGELLTRARVIFGAQEICQCGANVCHSVLPVGARAGSGRQG